MRCIVHILLTGTILLSGCASAILVDRGLSPNIDPSTFEKQRVKMEKRVPGITSWTDSLACAGILRDTFVIFDGHRLHSCYAEADSPSGKTAIIVHGYGVIPTNIMMLARMYRDSLGYNVWMPTLRHHGLSEGEAIQMGWYDRLDVIKWSQTAHIRFRDSLQVFHGMSMGAATVMMASGEVLPDYVRGFVEDCGYTDVWNELIHAIRHKAHLPAHPLAENAEKLCRKRYGWDFHEASSVNQLALCERPVLFIHGEKDSLVPCSMAKECYEAKTQGYRELWIAPGSEHSFSYPDHPDEYLEKVRDFITDNVENQSNKR